MVQVGNLVTIKGTKGYYIPTNDTNSATALGYKGQLQLSAPEVLLNDNKTDNAIPSGAITTTTVKDIVNMPLTTDYSGKIYRVKGRYTSTANTEFTNYTLTDLNRVDSLLAYTQCNGKDFTWSDELVGSTLEMDIILSIGKPSVSAWRFCPLKKNADVTVTDAEEVDYALDRCASLFNSEYDVETTVNVPDVDPLLEGCVRSFTSDTSSVVITKNADSSDVLIKVSTLGKFSFTESVTYKDVTKTKTIEVEAKKGESFDTISIADARAKADGTEVTIEATVARVTYKGSMTKQGLFLADATGSLFAFGGTGLDDVNDGNKVTVKGTMTHYIKNADNATAEGYDGDLQLASFTVEKVDSNVYDVPLDSAITGKSISDLAYASGTNLTSNMYRLNAVVYKSSGNYPSFSLEDVADNTITLPLYSQNSANDFTWLDAYVGKTVDILVGIQNLNLKSKNSFYRGVPLKVFSEIV